MTGRQCSRCGTPTTSIDNCCDDCIGAINAAERAAQGLPRYLDDPVTIDRLARITDPARTIDDVA